MKCTDCQWKYPETLLHQMMINGSYTEPICGICALQRANKLGGGSERTRFRGEQAESIRLGAIKWRNTHPADAPSVN